MSTDTIKAKINNLLPGSHATDVKDANAIKEILLGIVEEIEALQETNE